MLPPIRKRTWLILLGVIAVPALSICLTLAWPREPSYNGKSLTYWLGRYLPPATGSVGHGVAADAPAVEAFRAIGTNGIPTLLRLIRAHDAPLKLKLIALAVKQHLVTLEVPGGPLRYNAQFPPATPPKQKHRLRVRFTPADVRHQWAELGFRLLRSAGSKAVPSLVEVLDADPWGDVQWSAVQALGDIGPAATPAVPALLRVLAGRGWRLSYLVDRSAGRACLSPVPPIPRFPFSVLYVFSVVNFRFLLSAFPISAFPGASRIICVYSGPFAVCSFPNLRSSIF